MTASAATNNGSIYGFSEMKNGESQTHGKEDRIKDTRVDSSTMRARPD